MKKVKNPYAIELQSEMGEVFINFLSACSMCQMVALKMAMQGFLTTVTLDPINKKAECCVHFDLPDYPKRSDYERCTYYDVTSHPYWRNGEEIRVRCKTFYFKTKK